MKRLLAVLLLVPPLSQVAASDVWTTSTTGGSTIEIPTFVTEGSMRALLDNGEDMGTSYEPDEEPLQIRQYRTTSTGTPIAFLSELNAGDIDEVTYTVDRPKLGVLSGYLTDHTEICYGMCRKAAVVYCFDARYPVEDQARFGAMIERIAASFK